ncbi:late embryogenesis abundant protein D-34-like [Lycium barbarum]|uniref:late embryogenesis abundant protein D-34-like n=1 Tax=Lycium barbarum TaxID=112863 RepID=UPI00293F4ECE|nr:late embryogenesis abundant protein D-34-like [Lycium barbarum]
MSQEQQPIKYGDVFEVSEKLASKPMLPKDAATMQSAENKELGHIPKGGPASIMQSAAALNRRFGGVGRDDMTDVARNEGVDVSQEDLVEGTRIVTESVGGEVIAQYTHPSTRGSGAGGKEVGAEQSPTPNVDADVVTIGEALELAALSAGDKPVDESDAAAIQAAEVRATGLGHVVPGGVGAEAQHAAAINTRTTRDEQKTKLSDVLTDATSKLKEDKPVTKEDAEGVVGAEIRNKAEPATHPGGVAASMATAANMNKD